MVLVDVSDRPGKLFGPRSGFHLVLEVDGKDLVLIIIMIKSQRLPVRVIRDLFVALLCKSGNLCGRRVIDRCVRNAILGYRQNVFLSRVIVIDELRVLRVGRVDHVDHHVTAVVINRCRAGCICRLIILDDCRVTRLIWQGLPHQRRRPLAWQLGAPQPVGLFTGYLIGLFGDRHRGRKRGLNFRTANGVVVVVYRLGDCLRGFSDLVNQFVLNNITIEIVLGHLIKGRLLVWRVGHPCLSAVDDPRIGITCRRQLVTGRDQLLSFIRQSKVTFLHRVFVVVISLSQH